MSTLQWAAIQPLTGGMYVAAEQAFKNPAKWILSYPGLEQKIFNKDGKCINMGNERHLLEYLKKKKSLPPYIQFTHGMFDYEWGSPVTYQNDNEYSSPFDLKQLDNYKGGEIDLVCAVPVCSGLSGANTQDHGKLDSSKNNNLKFLTKYVLQSIKPKVYIFENAPGLYTNKGNLVREYLNDVAMANSYSVTYIKTDTNLHHNIQSRPRTFVIFWKGIAPPMLNYEQAKEAGVLEYLAKIPKKASQNSAEHILNDVTENLEFKFLKKKFGPNWRDTVERCRFKSFIIANKLSDEFYKFHEDAKLKAHYDYCISKRAIQKGYFDRSFFSVGNEKFPTVYHGNSWSALHPKEDRCLTFREYMHLMGLPADFEYQHTRFTFGSVIGQNVPVGTAYFWINECKRVLENWPKAGELGIMFHDNIHPTKQAFWRTDVRQ